MSKKLMMLALAAVSAAMFALPAVASAGNWHLEKATGGATGPELAVTGGASTLSTSGNFLTVKGTGMSGTAKFNENSTTTGVITAESNGVKGGLKFTGVTSLGFPCNSTGQVVNSGIVLTTPLAFHLEKIETETPGLLVTPNGGGAEPNHFASFSCAGIPSVVRGNGVFGDVTNKCSEETEKGTAVFQTTGVNGVQKYKQVTTTGTSYSLEASTNGGAFGPAAMEITTTMTGVKSKVNCTLP
jgi:hypothetical protein